MRAKVSEESSNTTIIVIRDMPLCNLMEMYLHCSWEPPPPFVYFYLGFLRNDRRHPRDFNNKRIDTWENITCDTSLHEILSKLYVHILEPLDLLFLSCLVR